MAFSLLEMVWVISICHLGPFLPLVLVLSFLVLCSSFIYLAFAVSFGLPSGISPHCVFYLSVVLCPLYPKTVYKIYISFGYGAWSLDFQHLAFQLFGSMHGSLISFWWIPKLALALHDPEVHSLSHGRVCAPGLWKWCINNTSKANILLTLGLCFFLIKWWESS